MFATLGKMFKEACQDNATGRYSHSRIIALFVALGATVFMWKLIIIGGMSIEYFVAYLTYGTGYQTMNKYLDNRDTARAEQARAELPVVKQNAEEDYPVPPKE